MLIVVAAITNHHKLRDSKQKMSVSTQFSKPNTQVSYVKVTVLARGLRMENYESVDLKMNSSVSALKTSASSCVTGDEPHSAVLENNYVMRGPWMV